MLTEEVRQIQERAARRMPDPWEVENLCESWLEQSATIVLLREALDGLLAIPADRRMPLPGDWEARVLKARTALSALPEQAGVSDRELLDWLDDQVLRGPDGFGIVGGGKTMREVVSQKLAQMAALGAAEGEG